jgi:hypothetical protein
LSGRSIEVIVGAVKHVTFSVHENIICAASHFFKKAMSGDWSESRNRSVRLEHDEPEVFQIYMHWLYRDTLPVRIDSVGVAGNAEYLQLAKAYVLGDLLQDGNFKDVVLDAIIEKTTSKASDGHRWYPVGPVIRHIYDNTLESSEARGLLVDLYTHHACGHWLYKWACPEDLPKQFLHDLAIAVLDKRVPKETPHSPDSCKYHQHIADKSVCYRNRLA